VIFHDDASEAAREKPALLNDLADEFLRNSARWFPALHASTHTAVVHFALGLGGEVGELLECDGADPDEVADVVTYAMDMARILGGDLSAAYDALPDQVGNTPREVAIAAGLAINLVKKYNRGDYDQEHIAPLVAHHVAMVIAISRNIVGDLLGALDAKRAICEARWGRPANEAEAS
jgi:NTP pyrophosphatase (non-canonical NTP hydrolase)